MCVFYTNPYRLAAGIAEQEQIEETITPSALNTMTDWILERTTKNKHDRKLLTCFIIRILSILYTK